MNHLLMHRREALQKLAILFGGTLSLPVQAALLGEKTNPIPIDIPAHQQTLIAHLAEVIMPATDTPGAKAAGVDGFVVRVIRDCTAKPAQEQFMEGLRKTDAISQSAFSKPFSGLDFPRQTEIVSELARQEREFFLNLKELVVVGFFTSETGITQVLNYVPVPGRFQGDLPLQPGQRSWAT
jgi:hypothetical protein